MTSERSFSEYERRLIHNVATFGCQVVSVFDPENDTGGFSYSVGLWESIKQPEIIIMGLDGSMGNYAITETLRQCRDGLRLFDGQKIENLIEGFSVACMARKVSQEYLIPTYFNSALWYHHMRTGGALTDALQLVWTYNGYYPWDQDAPAELIEDQPALYERVMN